MIRSLMVVAAAVTTLITLVGCSGGDDAPPTTTPISTTTTVIDPAELPEVDLATANADLEYIDGDGAPLLQMVDAVESIASADGVRNAEACGDLFDGLTDAGSPEELAGLATGVNDDVLGSSFESVRSAAGQIMSVCQQSDTDDPVPTGEAPTIEESLTQAADASALARQRITQLEDEG